MDIRSLIKGYLTQENVKEVATRAGVAEGDTKGVLEAAADLAAGNYENGSLNLASLAGLVSQKDAAPDVAGLISSVLGEGGAANVAAASGVSEENTNSVMTTVAPMALSAIGEMTGGENGSPLASLLGGVLGGGKSGGGLNLGSLVSGLFGGAQAKAEDAADAAEGAAAAAGEKAEEKTEEAGNVLSGIMGALGGLFGGK